MVRTYSLQHVSADVAFFRRHKKNTKYVNTALRIISHGTEGHNATWS